MGLERATESQKHPTSFPTEVRIDKVHPGCPLCVTLQTAQGDSSGGSFPSWRDTGNTHTLLVYSAGRTAQLSSCHPASHQPSQEICWMQHPSGIGHAEMCTTVDGLGEEQAPKDGVGDVPNL